MSPLLPPSFDQYHRSLSRRSGDPGPSTEAAFISAGHVYKRFDQSNPELFKFVDDQWRVVPDPSLWYGGTVSRREGDVAEEVEGDVESVRISFWGQSAWLYGSAPTNNLYPGKRAKVSVAGQPPVELNFSSSDAPNLPTSTPMAPGSSNSTSFTYRRWYTSRDFALTEQMSTELIDIIFYNLPVGMTVDYGEILHSGIGVTWQGSSAVADSADRAITYLGSWEEAGTPTPGESLGWPVASTLSSPENGNQPLAAEAYGGSAHVSRTVGDSMSLYFFGEEISMWGFLAEGQQGTVDASFSIDGSHPETIKFGSESSLALVAPEAGPRWKQHVKLFSKGGLTPTPHSLVVNITAINTLAPGLSSEVSLSPALYIDYFTMTNPAHVTPTDLGRRTLQRVVLDYEKGALSPLARVLIPLFVCLFFATVLFCYCCRGMLGIFGCGCCVRTRRPRSHPIPDSAGDARGLGEGAIKERKVRLDLEFSMVGKKNVLKSTILDIRPLDSSTSPDDSGGSSFKTPASPETAHLDTEKPPEYTFYPQGPSAPSSAPPRGLGTSSQQPIVPANGRRGSESSAASQELVGIVGYLSRVKARIKNVVGDGVDGWGRSFGTWTGTWTGRRQGVLTTGTLPPPYRSVGDVST